MSTLCHSFFASFCIFCTLYLNVVTARVIALSSRTNYNPREYMPEAEEVTNIGGTPFKREHHMASRSLSKPRPIDEGFIILGVFFTIIIIVSGFMIGNALRKNKVDKRPVQAVQVKANDSVGEQEVMLRPKRADYLVADYTHRLSRIPVHAGIHPPPLKPLSKLRTSMTKLSHAILPSPASSNPSAFNQSPISV